MIFHFLYFIDLKKFLSNCNGPFCILFITILSSSQKIIKLITENIPPENRKYLIDATFNIVPRGCFNQLLIIYTKYIDDISISRSNVKTIIQLINILRYFHFFVQMDKKAKNAYEGLFKYIKNNIFDMEPAIVITDYEQALRNVLQMVFPNATHVGCW